MCFPRMKAEGWLDEVWEGFRQLGDIFPIVFAGAIDDTASHPSGSHFRDDPRGIGETLEVVVRVVEGHGAKEGAWMFRPRRVDRMSTLLMVDRMSTLLIRLRR